MSVTTLSLQGAETRGGMGDTSIVNCDAGLLNSQPIFKAPPADTNQADRDIKCNAVERKFVMALKETFHLYCAETVLDFISGIVYWLNIEIIHSALIWIAQKIV